jgi:hypothetical protein
MAQGERHAGKSLPTAGRNGEAKEPGRLVCSGNTGFVYLAPHLCDRVTAGVREPALVAFK